MCILRRIFTLAYRLLSELLVAHISGAHLRDGFIVDKVAIAQREDPLRPGI
jgi:hypothetical protein